MSGPDTARLGTLAMSVTMPSARKYESSARLAPKLVVMEFALVYGDDWFELPLPLPVGALSHVATLVVTGPV